MKAAKAAVLHEQKKPLVVEEIEVEEPHAGEVLVRMAAAGVCRSDLHVVDGLWPAPLPLVMGHEGAGIVESVGEGVTLVAPGDHVIFSWAPSCGVCRHCVAGRPYLCTAGPVMTMKDGTTRFRNNGHRLFHQTAVSAFSEYTVTHETALVKIRDDMPLEKAALIGCGVMTGVGAVMNTAKVTMGSSVAVFGCGGVGLSVVQAANMAGAYPLIAVDILDDKLEMAKRLGATHVVNSTNEDPVRKIIEIVGHGVDFAFEAIGVPEVVAKAFDATDPSGTTLMVGMPPAGAVIPVSGIGLLVGKTLKGAYYGSTRFRIDMPALVELCMCGKLKLDDMITNTLALDDINQAFDWLRRGEVARSVIKF
jgi:S-(hydroxymethyl)glutathione dehydrogenase/alcohol dehydrogenase